MRLLVSLSLITLGASLACAPADSAPDSEADTSVTATPEAAFWTALGSLCGRAFAGAVVENIPPDPSIDEQPLVMHVRQCEDSVIRVPFHVGDDRSRTWVISRTADGLRLKHDHRHADGTEDDVTQYGGDTVEPGSATTQEFPADEFTASLVPTAATNTWTLEIAPGERFVYALRRGGSNRRFRAVFDLAVPVPAPPPPWGS